LKREEYKFKNVYIITTYRCNHDCEFCLFKFNKEKEVSTDIIIDRLKHIINTCDEKLYLKITGGEPFLKIKLLNEIIELSNENKDKIYKIGIGSNGSISIPSYFNNTKNKIDIFFSRHANIEDNPIDEIMREIKSNLIRVRLNCNMIKGKIDTYEKIIEYLTAMEKMKFGMVTFRELNKINIKNNNMYPQYILEYDEYYKQNLIKITDILKKVDKDKRFCKSRVVGNAYDDNIWYWYKDKISVMFRKIDEKKLLKYNNKFKGIDEYVIHPDGTLTGCWDKETKILTKGGEYAK